MGLHRSCTDTVLAPTESRQSLTPSEVVDPWFLRTFVRTEDTSSLYVQEVLPSRLCVDGDPVRPTEYRDPQSLSIRYTGKISTPVDPPQDGVKTTFPNPSRRSVFTEVQGWLGDVNITISSQCYNVVWFVP